MPAIIEPVPGFPGYLAGTDGSAWSQWKLRRRSDGGIGSESYVSDCLIRLKATKRKDGYLRVALRKDGRYHYFLLHQLILLTFVGQCPEGQECLHDDGDKENCKLTNLRYGTREENIADSIRHGVFFRATEAAAIANRGKPRSADVRARISATHKKRKRAPEHQAAINRARWGHA